MQATLEGRLLDVEGKVEAQNIRIATLEKFMEEFSTAQRHNAAAGSATMEHQIANSNWSK